MIPIERPNAVSQPIIEIVLQPSWEFSGPSPIQATGAAPEGVDMDDTL